MHMAKIWYINLILAVFSMATRKCIYTLYIDYHRIKEWAQLNNYGSVCDRKQDLQIQLKAHTVCGVCIEREALKLLTRISFSFILTIWSKFRNNSMRMSWILLLDKKQPKQINGKRNRNHIFIIVQTQILVMSFFFGCDVPGSAQPVK